MDGKCGELMKSSAKFKLWMTIVESEWNLWVWLVGVVSMGQAVLVGVGGIYSVVSRRQV